MRNNELKDVTRMQYNGKLQMNNATTNRNHWNIESYLDKDFE